MDRSVAEMNNNAFLRDFPQGYFAQNPVNGLWIDISALTGHQEFDNADFLLDWLQDESSQGLTCRGSTPDMITLEALFYEQRSIFFREGKNTLAIGFPILRISDFAEEPLSIPVFLWDLELKRHQEFFSAWLLCSGGRARARINPFLLRYLDRYLGVSAEEPLKGLLKNKAGKVSWVQSLYDLLSLWMPGITLQEEVSRLQYHPIRLAEQKGKGPYWLYAAAVAGAFPSVYINRELSESRVEKKINTNLHSVFPLLADPYQQEVLHRAGTGLASLEVFGGAGTGKTHTLAQLVLHALSNSRRVMVLASSISGLRDIQRYLLDYSLHDLQYLLLNVGADSAQFLQFLQHRPDSGSDTLKAGMDEQWKRLTDDYHRSLGKLDRLYAAVRTEILGELTWPQVLGMFLRSNVLAGKDRLDSQMMIPDMVFDEWHYHDLRRMVLTAEVLHAGLGGSSRHLSGLSPDIFLTRSKPDARKLVLSSMDSFRERAMDVRRAFGRFAHDYTDALLGFFQGWFVQIKDQLEVVELIGKNADTQFGVGWTAATDESLAWKRFFGVRNAAILATKKDMVREWGKLVQLVNESPMIHYGLAKIRPLKDISDIRRALESFSAALVQWKATLCRQAMEASSRLGTKTIQPEFQMSDRWQDLTQELSDFIGALNGSGLFTRNFEDVMLSLARKQAFLEEIIEFIEDIVAEMPNFDAFFDWHRFWLGLSDSARNIVQALIRLRSSNWEASYDSWFFYQALLGSAVADFPRQVPDLVTFQTYLEGLRKVYPMQIGRVWERIRTEEYKRTKRGFWGNREKNSKGINVVDGEWFNANFDPITSRVPVLLMGPDAAEKLLPGLRHKFDLVLVDDAAYVPKGLLELAKASGKQWVFFSPVSPLSAMEQDRAAPQLSICHLWPPGCIDIFLDPHIQVSTEAISDFKVRFVQVGGRYDASTEVNEAEAAEVVQILNDIQETPQRTLPRVIIAALTKAQRNLIAAYIDRIKYRDLPGVEKIRQLERNGLLICTAGEMAGVDADVVLISGTYGPVSIKGDLPGVDSGAYSTTLLEDLQVLSGRIRKEVVVLNSIPEEILDPAYIGQQAFQDNGLIYLLHYFAYLRALDAMDSAAQGTVIASLRKLKGYAEPVNQPRQDREGVLYDRIAEGLALFFPKERIVRGYREAQFYFPLVVLGESAEDAKSVVLLDGFWAEGSSSNMEWELLRTRSISGYNFKVTATFSIHWLLEPDVECQRLAAAIGS